MQEKFFLQTFYRKIWQRQLDVSFLKEIIVTSDVSVDFW